MRYVGLYEREKDGEKTEESGGKAFVNGEVSGERQGKAEHRLSPP